MKAQQMARDGEPQPGTLIAAPALVDLVEALEDPGGLSSRHTDARVDHLDMCAAAVSTGPYGCRTARWCELDGVMNEIHQDLLECGRISQNRSQSRLHVRNQMHALLLGGHGQAAHDLIHNMTKLDRFELEAEPTRLEPRQL